MASICRLPPLNFVVMASFPDSDSFPGFDELFHMSLDNMCVAGFDGRFKRVNPSWTRTLGWSAEELLATPVVDLVHPEDRAGVLAGRQRLIAGAALGHLVNRYRGKDGAYRWFEWRSVANIERRLVYATARDVTERKHAEERQHALETQQRQLVLAERLASVGTLAAGLAHEINNPLAAVMANLELIEDVAGLDEGVSPAEVHELRNMVSDARAGAERIRNIVRRLKTFSRAGDGERRRVLDVRPLFENAIALSMPEIGERAKLVTHFGNLPRVEADDARLGQVFVNLLLNAAHAIPGGHRGDNEVCVSTSTDDAGRAVVEVRDTGTGIPASLIGRVFDPFFTTKPVGAGTGLGLSLCHAIVTRLGGEITVESEEGRGTTFRVALPPA